MRNHLLIIAAVFLATATPLAAQEAPAETVEDIVVTARRIEGPMWEVRRGDSVLILVGAEGFSYEEAAVICNCAVGTIKSRVARARIALEQILEHGVLPPRSKSSQQDKGGALAEIMADVDRLSGGSVR